MEVAESAGQSRSKTISRSGQLTMQLELSAKSIGHTRRIVKEHAQLWDIGDLDESLGFVVTELLTNVLLHAKLPTPAIRADLLVQRIPGGAVAVVHDDDPTIPRLEPGDVYAESGRGLQLVRDLATDLAFTPSTCGKDVTAILMQNPGPHPPGEAAA